MYRCIGLFHHQFCTKKWSCNFVWLALNIQNGQSCGKIYPNCITLATWEPADLQTDDVNLVVYLIPLCVCLTLTVPQEPWFLKTVTFLVAVDSIPGSKSSGMSTDLSANLNNPFGSSLAVIVRKAFDGLLILPSSPVWIPRNDEVSNVKWLHRLFKFT